MKISATIKKFFYMVAILFLTLPTLAYAGSFTVVPVVTEKEVIRDVCPTASDPGALAFQLVTDYYDYDNNYKLISIMPGATYKTTTGHLVEITGANQWWTRPNGRCLYTPGNGRFRVTPSNMSDPEWGERGTYYLLCEDAILVQADLL